MRLVRLQDFVNMLAKGIPACTTVKLVFDDNYQQRIDKFAARKLLTEAEYFKTPYVDRGEKTPQLEDIIFEVTRLINQNDLNIAVESFKGQTAAFTKTGNWTAQDVRKAIDAKATFETCVPIPAYALDKRPVYKFKMNKKELILYMYQNFFDQDVLLSTFKTTKGGAHYNAKAGKATGFSTPSGNFFVKRIVYAPSYIHPAWSKSSGHMEAPGFGNSYGIVMAELWKTDAPLCIAESKKCNGYAWDYFGGTGIRFHTSNKDSNVRNSKGQPLTSHGCNRLFTKDGKRIFTLLYNNVPHAECKKVQRGTVCPFLDTTISYTIVEK